MIALYTLIPQNYIHDRLSVLSSCLSVSVRLLDEKGNALMQFGGNYAYCTLFQNRVKNTDTCMDTYIKSGKIAYALGETYIFSCKANLTLMAFPLVSRKLLLGTVIVGPFIMDIPDSTLITSYADESKLSSSVCLELYDGLKAFPIIEPQRVKQFSELVEYILSPMLSDDRIQMISRQEALYQQSKINEMVQLFKQDSTDDSSDFIYQKEQELLSKVRLCDLPAARAAMNELLGYVFFHEGRNNDNTKNRALELTTLLSRVVIEAGAPIDNALKLNLQYLAMLQRASSYEELCYSLQKIVESFIETISLPPEQSVSGLVHEAVRYIGKNYDKPLSIQSLADHLGISPTYFSGIFSKQMKVGFHEYLTRVRIEEAKTVLKSTDYPISQIAIAVGYADQSSFTKAFKRITGVTPKQLR